MEIEGASNFDLYSCEVCFNTLLDQKRKPRTLHCNHTYCSACLQQLLKNGVIKCPRCRLSTRIPSVDDLPVNVDIARMKEREDKLIQKKDEICFRCFKKGEMIQATKHCKTCNRKMCQSCRDFHNSTPAFKKHVLEDIKTSVSCKSCCNLHKSPSQYICVMCMEEICTDCVFEGLHDAHKEFVEDYEMGLKSVKEAMSIFKSRIDDVRHLTKMFLSPKPRLPNLETTYDHVLNTFSCGKLLAKIKKHVYGVRKHHEKPFSKIDLSLGQVSTILSNVAATEGKSDSPSAIVAKIAKQLEMVLAQVELCEGEPMEKETTFQNKFALVNTPVSLCTLNNMEESNVSVKKPSEIDCDGECIVFCDHTASFVQMISLAGELLGTYYTLSGHGDSINGVQLVNGILYIAQEVGISIIPLVCPAKGRFVKPSVGSVACIGVLGDFIYILDYRNGSVVQYNPQNSETKTVVRGLKCPIYIGISLSAKRDGEICFVITHNEGIVTYDKYWEPLKEIPSNGSEFAGTAILPNGKLLLAETNRHQINIYNIHGQKEKTLLSSADGLYLPQCIACNNGILCFTESNTDYQPQVLHGAVKVFKIAE